MSKLIGLFLLLAGTLAAQTIPAGVGIYSLSGGGGGGGTGDVVGPASSTDTAIALFDGTTGKLLKNSLALIDTSGNIATPGSFTTGVGGGVAGTLQLGEGTAPSTVADTVQIIAPTNVTSAVQYVLETAPGSTGYFVGTVSGAVVTLSKVGNAEKIASFSLDGAGSVITTGTISGTSTSGNVGYTLTAWSISATGATGTITFKIWNAADGTAIPTIANVINTSGVSLTTGTHLYSTTISDFTDTTFAAKDQFRCAVTAVDGAATDLTVTLYGTRL